LLNFLHALPSKSKYISSFLRGRLCFLKKKLCVLH
jgi:hypothetical protein